MLQRFAFVLVFGLLAPPLAAFDSGDVLFKPGDVLFKDRTALPPSGISSTTSWDFWIYRNGWNFAMAVGWPVPLDAKEIPIMAEGRFLILVSNKMVFHHDQTVSAWDGVPTPLETPGKGYTDIFSDNTELSEIAPMRSGYFLVAERWNDRTIPARLIQFNANGIVAVFSFPTVVDPISGRALGARHIEVLADQCTVLYTLGSDDPAGNRVRRLNICTRQPETDFASLLAGEYAGAIRQLPSGDVLVANGKGILQFSPDGTLRRVYGFSGVTHIALSPDGLSFWAAGVDLDAHLGHFDPAVPLGGLVEIPLGNPEMTSDETPQEVSDLVVAGEWRAALTGRSRGVREH